MIKKEPKHPGYGKYFLAMEAPGDAPLRKNMKVITVRPSKRVRLDFTSNDLVVSDEPEPELPEIDDPVDSDVDLPEIDDGDVGVDDLPDIDDDLSDLPDIDPTQTQNDPDELPSIDEPTDTDLPDIDPVGSSDDDLPDIDDEPDMDVDLPDVDDTDDDLPDIDDNTTQDVPDMGDDTDLPDIDDETQSTNINVSPETGDEDFTSPDTPQSTNVEVTPNDTGDQSQQDDDYTIPSTDDATPPAVDASTDTGEDDNTDYTQSDTPDADTGGDDGGDDTDYTQTDDTSGDASTGDQGTDTTQNDANNQQNKGPGLEFDSVRKYNLYKEYVKLRTAIDNYITKLESCISDDPRSNQVIKTCTSKFRELYDLITDYMMMKFELCSYIQNLLFYQRQIATVQLIFSLLQETNRAQDKDEKKKESKSKRKNVR